MVPLSPWAVLISWEKPYDNRQIKNVKISGDIQHTISNHLEEKYQFLFLDTGIRPGSDISVGIDVYYFNGPQNYGIYGALVEKHGTFFWRNVFQKTD